MYDTILSNYPRLKGEIDDSPRIKRAVEATENGILCIPKGDYEIAEPITISNRCSLDMHPAARLTAVKEMDFVIKYISDKDYHALSLFNDDGTIYDNLGLFVKGGDIDGCGLASCFAITNAHHFTLTDTVFHNGKKYGLCIGGKTGGHIYELICNNVYCKCTMKGLSGNIGIYSDKCDAHFNDCIIVDYTVGMRMLGSANRLTRCHIWGGTVPPENISVKEWSDIYAERKKLAANGVYGDNEETDYINECPEMLIDSIAFDIRAANTLYGCYADTARVGFLISSDTRLICCDFFNNKLMGLKKSTAIKHIGGKLSLIACTFRGTAGTEILYEGEGNNVEWISSTSCGGDGMRPRINPTT